MNDSAILHHEFDRRLVDGLYVEAMVMADEARSYFDHSAEGQREALDKIGRVEFACESLKVTTRLMQVIAWLLTQRAIFNGELAEAVRGDERYQLGGAAASGPEAARQFGPEMAGLIVASEELYTRIGRLELQLLGRWDTGHVARTIPLSPARDLQARLELAF